MRYVYMGERFAGITNGWIGTFTDSLTGFGVEWADLQQALRDGEEVHVRPATPDELAAMEAVLALYLAKGGTFTPVVPQVHQEGRQ